MKKIKIEKSFLFQIIVLCVMTVFVIYFNTTYKQMRSIETNTFVYKYGVLSAEYDTLTVSKFKNNETKNSHLSDTIYNEDSTICTIINKKIEYYRFKNPKEYTKTSIIKNDYDKIGIKFVYKGKEIKIN